MRKHSLGAQAAALFAMRDRGAIDALRRHVKLKDSERDYFEETLLAAARSLRLFADHEEALREMIKARTGAK